MLEHQENFMHFFELDDNALLTLQEDRSKERQCHTSTLLQYSNTVVVFGGAESRDRVLENIHA